MTTIPTNTDNLQEIAIDRTDIWQAYYRLQELEIPCQCGVNQPLQVQLSHPIAAIQVWSVIKYLRGSRNELITWLNDCWYL